MIYSNWLAAVGVGTIALLGACTPPPEPVATVIYAEPTFDKFGNPSCRPGNVPIGGAYTQGLPICAVISTGAVAGTIVTPSDDGVPSDDSVMPDYSVDDTVPEPDSDDTSGNGRIQNQNQNRNSNG